MTMQATGTTPALVGVAPEPATELPAKKNGAPHAHAHPQIPKAIVDAIRSEMKALVEAEDLDANLILLEQLAGRARELFMTFKAPHARFTRRGPGGIGYAYAGDVSYGGSTLYTSGFPASSQFVGAPEQFGAKAIREIISILPELLAGRSESASPDKLVDAIAAAKKNGEEEIAKELTARLLAKPENITEKITKRLKGLLPQDAPGEGIQPADDESEDGAIITVGAETDESNGAPPPATNGVSAS